MRVTAYHSIALLTSLTAFCAYSQTTGESLHFEAVSLKPTPPGKSTRGIPGPGVITRGKVTIRGCSLTTLLAYAYDVGEDQILGPSWMDTANYDVFATMAASTTRQKLG